MSFASAWGNVVQSTLSSEMGVRLAKDILEDHFGGSVATVGALLIRRGALSVQEIVRYVVEEHDNPSQDPLRFQHVRNALLTLVQHGLVSVKPHPQAAQNEALRGLLHMYSLRVDDVFARMRFPHYLEHCYWHYGDLAAELMACVLKYGRVTAEHAVADVRRGAPDVSEKDLHALFQRLVDDRLVRQAQPFGSAAVTAAAASASSSSSSAAPPPSEIPPAPAGGEATATTAQGDGDEGAPDGGDGENAGEGPAKRRRTEEGASAVGDAVVPRDGTAGGAGVAADSAGGVGGPGLEIGRPLYMQNWPVLTMCVVKNLICRFSEERAPGISSQVIAALLTEVSPPKDPAISQEASVAWMTFPAVAERLRTLGLTSEGRDPARQKETIRLALQLLSNPDKEGFVRKRSTSIAAGKGAAAMAAPGAAASGSGRSRRSSSAAAQIAPVGAVTSGQIEEWSIEWRMVRKVLANSMTSQFVRDQFGTIGLRMFKLLSEGTPPQKLEEGYIFSTCMIPPQEGREVLNEMVRRGIICWQEVPRSGSTPLVASWWLYYVDHRRVEAALLWCVMQSILNLRIRFRVECAKNIPLESRVESLSKKERSVLREGRRAEDILERAFLVSVTSLIDFVSC